MKIKAKQTTSLFNKIAVRNIGYLSLGQGITHVISLIGALYIPKTLGPEEFGSYQTVLSYVGIFTVFTFSGLNKVALRNSSKDINGLSNEIESILGIRYLLTIFAAIIAVLIAKLSGKYNSQLVLYISIYVTWLFIRTIEGTVNLIFQAHEKLIFLSLFSVLKSLLLTSTLIIAIFSGGSLLTLLTLDIVVSVFILILSFQRAQRLTVIKLFPKISFHLKGLREGISFSILSFMNTLGNKIDIVMISFFGTATEVGIYALANTLVRKGLMARRAISTSIFPIYARKAIKSLGRSELNKHALITMFPSIILVVFIIISAEWIISNLIGNEFLVSVEIIKVLSFYLLFHYVSVPYEVALQATYQENTAIKIKSFLAVVNIIANYIFYSQYGLLGVAYSTVLVQMINLFTLFVQSNYLKPNK